MIEEKGEVLGKRQQARALARKLEMFALGVSRHVRPELDEDRRFLRRIGLARARRSWTAAVKDLTAAHQRVENLYSRDKSLKGVGQ